MATIPSIPAAAFPHAQTDHLTHPKYRRDIDGLRAVAVLSVVGFHAFPRWMPGGFIGVDIFFVISGFLISTIMFGSLARDSFSFLEFYSRRIRRIFPALIAVLVVSLTAGWFVLWQDEYRQLGKHAAGGAAFLSNFVLWKESGYFDTAAESKPLLHLWSLAVEEQFYICYPLLLWLAWKRRFNLLAVTVLIALVSFGFNIATAASDRVGAFYFPHIRFWELMTGAILAYLSFHKSKEWDGLKLKADRWLGTAASAGVRENGGIALDNCLSVLGAVLVASGLLAITREKFFPGWWALLPVLGAAMLIAGGSRAWVNRAVLSHPILVWFGLISYPLYLWHWVLLAFGRIIASGVPAWQVRLGLVAVSVLLAWLTYKLVETPLRFGKAGRAKTVGLAALMLVVCLLGYQAHRRDGYPERFVAKNSVTKKSGEDGSFAGMNQSCAGFRGQAEYLTCFQDPREAPRYALLGDSKAGALAPGVFRTSQPGGRWLYLGSGTIYPLLPIVSNLEAYPFYKQASIETAFEKIAQTDSVKYVVVATATRALFMLSREDSIDDLPQSRNYEIAFQGLLKGTERLIQAGKKVVLFVDNPTLPFPEDCLRRATSIDLLNDAFIKTNPGCRLDLNKYLRQREQYVKVLTEIKRRYPGDVEIFDATDILCDRAAGVCPFSRNSRAMYGVTDHISDYASGLVGRELNGFLAVR